ncbi:MAG: hypothetical protein DMD39_07510 [Gemmatimonadetes bacterium]|nr:MAG: hypothetical protein DMD39_07510 [Gemmatimonadota bacterium]
MKTFTHIRSFKLALALAGSLVACSSAKDNTASRASDSASAAGTLEGPTQNTSTAQASADSGMQTKMRGMLGMSGAMGGMMSAGMMDSMRTHMGMMEGMTGDRMKAMLPAHRQMVANMLSRMSSEMRQMNMQPDAKWTALTDSVRGDLVRMPDMSAAELRSAMPAHGARVMRLMQMHRSMISGTKK